MKTNRIILTIAFIALFVLKTNYSDAQGFYLRLGGGYSLPSGSQNIGVDQVSTTTSTSTSSTTTRDYKLVKGSLGRGSNAGITLGQMFTTKIGAELSINYLLGGKYKTSYKSTSSSNNVSNYDFEISAKTLRITPGVKLSTGSDKSNAYARAGIVIGLAGKLKTLETDINLNAPGTEITEREFKGGAGIGFMGALGGEFLLGRTCSIFTELCFISQSWAPTKSKITKYTVNGVDRLGTLTTLQKEEEYSNSYTYTSSNNFPDQNQPSKGLKTYLPMSSIGLNVGLHLMFGIKKESK